jgi:hypothetical protein
MAIGLLLESPNGDPDSINTPANPNFISPRSLEVVVVPGDASGVFVVSMPPFSYAVVNFTRG